MLPQPILTILEQIVKCDDVLNECAVRIALHPYVVTSVGRSPFLSYSYDLGTNIPK